MIAVTPGLPEPVSGRRTADAVALAWERTGLSLTRLAATMGMALSTLSLWKDGRRQPSLPGALRLCRIAGISLIDFLRAYTDAISAAPLPDPDLPYFRPSDEQHSLHDWSVVRERLESEITAEPPRSLASVLRELGLDTRQAKRTCARECAVIAERHRLWAVERVRVRREEKVALVRAAIAETLDRGDYPSRHQVQKGLPSSVSLREAALYAIWIDEAREPGRTFLKVRSPSQAPNAPRPNGQPWAGPVDLAGGRRPALRHCRRATSRRTVWFRGSSAARSGCATCGATMGTFVP